MRRLLKIYKVAKWAKDLCMLIPMYSNTTGYCILLFGDADGISSIFIVRTLLYILGLFLHLTVEGNNGLTVEGAVGGWVGISKLAAGCDCDNFPMDEVS